MNQFKTMMLLAALTALFMAAGFAIGGPRGALLALVVAAGMNLFTYWNADKLVLKMHKAREVDRQSHPEYYGLVAGLAQRAGLPMPKVYLVDDPHPNAFATGRDPEHAAVAATSGLLDMLSREEVAGVMAHELGHVKNRDTLIMTMVATIAGAVAMIANFGLFFRGRNAGMAGLAAVFLAPFAAMIVQMAISRTREYGADKAGAEISGDPNALASALEKISVGARAIPNHIAERNPAAAQLYIVPVGIKQMFSTHPPTQQRIAKLRAMGGAAPTSPSVDHLRAEMYGKRPPSGGHSALDPLGRGR